MPISQWNLEFLNHNAQRSYPITAEATKQDTTGSFEIPDSFLVGLDIPVPTAAQMQSGKFLIRQIGLFSSGIQVIVAYDTGAEVVNVASALIPTSNFTRNSVFALGGIDPFDDVYGKIVIGRIDQILEQPAGLFTFDIDGARLEPQTIRPMIRGITSISISDAAGNASEKLYGDIELVAGSNIQLSTVITSTETQVVISALNGEGTIEECICTGDATAIPCIKTINGIAPTADGNFSFLGDDCLTFTGTTNGLSLTDSCCTPCCGCSELEAITRDLERLSSQRNSLETFVNQLITSTTSFNSTVLSARLGDKRCLACE